VSVSTPAAAQSPGNVLIARVEGDDAIVSRVRAELRHDDWRVIEVALHSPDARRSLESLARARGASAALRARPSQLAVELWVAAAGDRDKAGSEEVLAGPRADLSVLAVRVTEVLRARGLVPAHVDEHNASTVATPSEADTTKKSAAAAAASPAEATPTNAVVTGETAAPAAAVAAAASAADKPVLPTQPAQAEQHAAVPPPTPAPPPPAAEPTPEPADTASASDSSPAEESSEPEADGGGLPSQPGFPALVYVELAPALVLSPGHLGPRFDAFVNVRLQPADAFSFSLSVLVPLAGSPVNSAAGSAQVRTLAAIGGADLQLPFADWEFSAGAGAGALITWIHGSKPPSNYQARDETQRTFSLLARLGLAWRISSVVRLSTRVLVGFSIPELRITFPDTKEVTWGMPYVTGALGLEFALPWER
jgi:hypothetical protein